MTVERIWGPPEFRAFVDKGAREIFGMSYEEFRKAFLAGHFNTHPKRGVACDLASLIPFCNDRAPRPPDGE